MRSVELIDHPRYGHCAVASQDILAGEVVIDEAPLLVVDYNVDTWAQPIASSSYKRKRGFMTLSRPGKVSLTIAHAIERDPTILDRIFLPAFNKAVKRSMAYKAADRGVSELRQRSGLFPEIEKFSNTDLINFSLAASANAHAFDENSIALLSEGCKITHTCMSPNVAASTRSYRGEDEHQQLTVKHIALRPIKKGEVLLGSYAKLTTFTTVERRKYLMDHKMFLCACEFCTRPDLTRGIMCQSCADKSLESAFQVAPLSTMYRSISGSQYEWKCQNCKASASDAEILARWHKSEGSEETWIRDSLSQDSQSCTPREDYHKAVEIYERCLTVFGWRHTHTASASLNVLEAVSRLIDIESSPDSEEIESALEYTTTLPPLLEQWFASIGIPAMDELTSILLLLSERLMTLSALHHDIIPRAMNLVQELLLKVRPVIEERRAWKIGHALEEYYDELLVILDDLVNGDAETQGEVIDEEELVKG